jgi:hypothetical protein
MDFVRDIDDSFKGGIVGNGDEDTLAECLEYGNGVCLGEVEAETLESPIHQREGISGCCDFVLSR